MANKQSRAAIILIVAILIILIVSAIVTLVYILNQKGFFKKDKPVDTPLINLYLKAKDSSTEQYIDANYLIESTNGIVAQGKLTSDAYTPIELDNRLDYNIYCWNENHYASSIKKQFTLTEKRLNKTKDECNINKVGFLNINHTGGLSEKDNTINFNITSISGFYHRLGMCFAWTAGIVDVIKQNEAIYCDSGIWKNWSNYYPENESYVYLPDGIYKCGESILEGCRSITANRCYPKNEIPPNYKNKVDSCAYTGSTLQPNEPIQITIQVKTLDFKNSLDYLDIYFYDMDLRWNEDISMMFYTPFDTIEIGAPILKYRIAYKKN